MASAISALSLVSIAHAENPQRLLEDCRTVIKYEGKTCDFSNTDCSVVTVPKNIALTSIETCNKSLIDGDTQGADALCDDKPFDCEDSDSSATQAPTSEPTKNNAGLSRSTSLLTMATFLTSYALMR